ncbi:CAP domain-containing protein [Streptomyces sp. G7(2002)]|uniref:CAP domain-containing protein n=1 Tax=Streptomyces sp. G7(2002) TaxID=2971798 RepID=UPI00237E2176|nr:CAP domain-containing protein [Streptomyces sp. G7(2002)]WDT52869.1 CAP domain-containing protein [Streptomyces sp. G7(2002)]
MNNDHLQTERHDETPAGSGRGAGEAGAHRRSGGAGAGGSAGGRHGRTSGTHRAGSTPRRKATLLAVAAVVTVGGASVVLIRPDSGADRALAADASVPSASTATVSAKPTPSTSRTPKTHKKPSASPSKAKRHGKRHSSPRPQASRPGSGNGDSAQRSAPRTPHVDSGAGNTTPNGAQAASGTAARFAQKVVELVNAQRAQHGCGPLTVDPRIQKAAQAHSDDMAARNYYEHNTPEGVDPGTRMTKAGFPWSSWAENIFKSPKDPATAVDGWMKSPGHRDNILNCSYKSTGVGVNLSGNGPWWTQDFGTRS